MSEAAGGRPIGVALLTISDKGARGEREDLSGPAMEESLAAAGLAARVVARAVVPDEVEAIREALVRWCAEPGVEVVLTSGGTGLAPRDVTPQATAAVVQYEVPGLAEAMRAESRRVTPAAMLSRGIAGVRDGRLIVNLPGSPKAVRETLAVVAPALPHAVQLLRGAVGDHTRPESGG